MKKILIATHNIAKLAELKAKYYGHLTGLSTISDDGGLTIPFLNNEPGVKSNRRKI